jgi:hypothetical protein
MPEHGATRDCGIHSSTMVGREIHTSMKPLPKTKRPSTSPHIPLYIALNLRQYRLALFRAGILQFSGPFLQRRLAQVILENLQGLSSRNYRSRLHDAIYICPAQRLAALARRQRGLKCKLTLMPRPVQVEVSSNAALGVAVVGVEGVSR